MYTWVIQSVETTKSKIYVILCATPPVASDAMQHLLRKSLIQPPFPDNIPTVPTSLKKSALFEIGIQSLIIWFPYILSESQ